MRIERELKTLEEAMKETNVNIIPYSITDIYLYESVLAMEEAHEKMGEENINWLMGLHHNTKHVPDWIESDEEYEKWSANVDRDYEELEKARDKENMLLEMIEELRKEIIVYTEEI